MSLTPRQLATEITVAYQGRAEDTHRNMLARLELLASGDAPDPKLLDRLTADQLMARRNELHVLLAAVNDRLQAHVRARRGALIEECGKRPGDGMVGFHADTISPLDPTSYCRGPNNPFVPPSDEHFDRSD